MRQPPAVFAIALAGGGNAVAEALKRLELREKE